MKNGGFKNSKFKFPLDLKCQYFASNRLNLPKYKLLAIFFTDWIFNI